MSNELFGKVLRWLDPIAPWCLTVPADRVSNGIHFTDMKHNTINRVLALRVSKLLCGSLSCPIVDSVV